MASLSVNGSRPLSQFLRMAVMAGVESAVQIHINRGDDLNARDSSGMTPLMLSAARNKPAICKLLLDAGVDCGMLDPSGKTAFAIAVAAGAREVLAVFETTKVSLESSDDSNQIGIAAAFNAGTSLPHPSHEHVITQNAPILKGVIATPAPVERVHYVDSEELQEFDLRGWEPENDNSPPIADLSVVQAATAIQQALTEYLPIDSSADWDDVNAYLPETALPLARTGDEESHERLRLLLLRALREGSVPRMEVEVLSTNNDRTANPEAEALLSMVINDLGAEVDERFEYVNTTESFLVFVKPEETSDEEEAVSDALAFIENLTSRQTEPLRIYQKEFQKHPLISAEQEILLAQEMESALDVALDVLAAWPHGIGLILDAGRLVVVGKRPLTWISRSLGEASSNIDPGSKDESDEEGVDDDVPCGSGSVGEHVVDFSDALKQLTDLPVGTIQQDAAWSKVRAALSSLRLSRQFLLELADAKDDQNSDAVFKYATAIKAYQCAREQMAVANLKLAFHIAKRYLYSGELLDDLAQEANIGLLKAVERFDWRRGFKFSTFATWWIRQQVGRYVADKGRTIRLPVHVYEKAQRLQREAQNFEVEMGRTPELGEIAARMEMPTHKVIALQRLPIEPLSIHELAIDELISVEVRSDFVSPDPMHIVFESQLRVVIDKMLASLEIKEQQVIRLRYGIGVAYTLTLEEIGKRYEVTRERIRQIEAKAMQDLKRPSRIGIFMQSVHGAASSPEGPKQKLASHRARRKQVVESTLDEQAIGPEDRPSSSESVPPSEPSIVEILFLQASALEAAIELNRKKYLEKTGLK